MRSVESVRQKKPPRCITAGGGFVLIAQGGAMPVCSLYSFVTMNMMLYTLGIKSNLLSPLNSVTVLAEPVHVAL